MGSNIFAQVVLWTLLINFVAAFNPRALVGGSGQLVGGSGQLVNGPGPIRLPDATLAGSSCCQCCSEGIESVCRCNVTGCDTAPHHSSTIMSNNRVETGLSTAANANIVRMTASARPAPPPSNADETNKKNAARSSWRLCRYAWVIHG
uniref:Secreted protein n=1 Tax=Plectus sambesii TaxID=2011161 RepID=A0A914WAM1_9BILA